jgi:hypothetical protein
VDSTEIERRAFFRISDRLLLEFKEVSRHESLVLEKSLKEPDILCGVGISGTLASPERSALQNRELYTYLENIDRKLDMLIELLSGKDSQLQSAYVDVTLSGSGLRYCSSTELRSGAYLELRILLPPFPGRRIRALGKVIRVNHTLTEDGEGWDTAVSFEAVSERDRDALIGYIVARERECLRTKQMP